MASKSRYVLPAVLISALAAAGMMGYVTPKKTPASQKADVQTVAARAGAEQFDSAATKKKSAEIAQETEESRRRRKQAALVAAVLVAAAVYGLRSSLLGVDKVSSPTALQGLLKKPESMHGIDPDASVDFQPDASVERQMEVPAEGAGDAVRGWQHLVRDFSAMLAGEYALSPRVGAVASAVALGLLAFSLAAARRASRRRQQQGEERPASPTAGEEQADPVPAEAADPAADPEQVGEKEPKKPEEKEAPAAPAAPAAEPEEIPKAEPEKLKEEAAAGQTGEQTEQTESGPKEERDEREEEPKPDGEERSEAAAGVEDSGLPDGVASVRSGLLQQVQKCRETVLRLRMKARSLETVVRNTQARMEVIKSLNQPNVLVTLSATLNKFAEELESNHTAVVANVRLGRLALEVYSMAEAVEKGQEDGVAPEQRAALEQKMEKVMSELEKLLKESETEDTEEGATGPGVTGSPPGPGAPSTDDIKRLHLQLQNLMQFATTTVAEGQEDPSAAAEPEPKVADQETNMIKVKEGLDLTEQRVNLLQEFVDSTAAAVAFFADYAQRAEDDLPAQEDVPGDSAEVQQLKDEVERRRGLLAGAQEEAESIRQARDVGVQHMNLLLQRFEQLQLQAPKND
ncbi:hypothetical protein NCLIV_012210 [Neospora caninum Liverpool]|uniref:Transmembrane protein n=1 Tax=Neospora caninum (strain Liverpool) TaxID=572307 RepID=F0V9Z3_NEOCL|nr:hypothetical protein NCLIV_012210 [Neospora caninum Liverpool]CBZ50755.1 hypothetical protein NCLIV_012210 [Neospora caninum Liverpool]CEL65371.1 TPA: hypothetical protein BN1204_012210 [Neospora caninum Liverpool]|eukprot:XP_003880788.1 hypothetical protein NCLIV_012210 [Neospora caninum Liverpool]